MINTDFLSTRLLRFLASRYNRNYSKMIPIQSAVHTIPTTTIPYPPPTVPTWEKFNAKSLGVGLGDIDGELALETVLETLR